MKVTTKNLTHFLLKGPMACIAALAGGNAVAADAKPNAVTAMDILLEPDATMISSPPRIWTRSMPPSAKSSPAPM